MEISKSIGALILTRNNSSTIRSTINSVSVLCSQIVVLDTGSTDGTPMIAQKSGAEVYFFEWIDDFSAARNQALKYLFTDWVLMIDSDELLSDFDFAQFNKINSDKSVGGINMIIDNSIVDAAATTVTSHRYTRLFRNIPGIRFRGRIHEQIRESIVENGQTIWDSNFRILHLGYSKNSTDKYERNQELIRKDIADNPQDDWLKYHLAGTHFAAGNDDEALKIFTQIIESNQLSIEQNEIVNLRLAQLYLKYDNYDAIIKLTNFVSDYPQNEALRCYVLATAQLFMNNFDDALTNLHKCLNLESPSLNQNDIQKAINIAEKMTNRWQ